MSGLPDGHRPPPPPTKRISKESVEVRNGRFRKPPTIARKRHGRAHRGTGELWLANSWARYSSGLAQAAKNDAHKPQCGLRPHSTIPRITCAASHQTRRLRWIKPETSVSYVFANHASLWLRHGGAANITRAVRGARFERERARATTIAWHGLWARPPLVHAHVPTAPEGPVRQLLRGRALGRDVVEPPPSTIPHSSARSLACSRTHTHTHTYTHNSVVSPVRPPPTAGRSAPTRSTPTNSSGERKPAKRHRTARSP